jgi:CheY-like chemotaxis protein
MANLLMIDDNPQSQKYLGRIIRHRTSHALVFAGDEPKGIEKIVERRPDLLFLDLFLPGTDGFELFTTLRHHPATHNVPIIIHTAIPFDDVTQIRLRRIPHDGLVEFPIEASELNRLINIALKRNSSQTQKWVPPRA